jgi:nicotinamide-nucleotide amidase
MKPLYYDLAEQLGQQLMRRSWRVTAAESCTGGGIASAITDIPGSSGWFDMAFVTYSNAAKQRLVGVDGATLAEHGAVSDAVVREMAAGACLEAHAHVAVAVSGIAGPGGGTAEKPVGMVCFAWVGPAGVKSETVFFGGDRASIRAKTVEHALRGLLTLLGADEPKLV